MQGEAAETPWPRGACAGGAWLSSARVVRCWVKSRNERNPCRVLPALSWGLARDCRRQAGGRWGRRQVIMPLYALGCTRATMAGTTGCDAARRSELLKAGPSSDRRLQLACVKPELLVIADQHAAVNTFPGLVHTARHTTRVVCTRSRRPNPQGGGGAKVEGKRG